MKNIIHIIVRFLLIVSVIKISIGAGLANSEEQHQSRRNLDNIINNNPPTTRIKDIASFEGVRENFLVGQGLVVGLNGTGDDLRNSIFTYKELAELLEKFKVNISGERLRTRNVAAVTVTASLPAFSRQGSKIDVRVNSIGDSRSLSGGTLLPTTMVGPDGNIYAIAYGTVVIPSFQPMSDEVKTRSNHIETTGIIKNGAIIETELDFDFSSLASIKLALFNPDFSTAKAVAEVINNSIIGNIAVANDAGTVTIVVPHNQKKSVIELVSNIEQLAISPDYKAKVIINEATGTIIIGNNVQIRPVAIAQGNLMINIGGGKVSQYDRALYGNNRAQRNNINQAFDGRRGNKVYNLSNGAASLNDVVEGLNQLGVMPRDIINILYNMKAVGALDAVIEVQ